MNQKEITEWLEDRGELMIMKKDGEGFVIAARSPDGMWKTAEAETLARAITLWEEACCFSGFISVRCLFWGWVLLWFVWRTSLMAAVR